MSEMERRWDVWKRDGCGCAREEKGQQSIGLTRTIVRMSAFLLLPDIRTAQPNQAAQHSLILFGSMLKKFEPLFLTWALFENTRQRTKVGGRLKVTAHPKSRGHLLQLTKLIRGRGLRFRRGEESKEQEGSCSALEWGKGRRRAL